MRQAEKDSRRPYQDPISPDFRKHVGIWADLERLRPKGDCVVIRVMPEPEQHANLIWIPERARGGGNAPKIGEVVAIGLGDRLFHWTCDVCLPWEEPGRRTTTWHAPEPCPKCKSRQLSLQRIARHTMYTKPGDRVVFWSVPANQVIVNDEVFQFVREEQHVLLVLDKEGPENGKGN